MITDTENPRNSEENLPHCHLVHRNMSHGQTWDRTRASEVGSRRLNRLSKARPEDKNQPTNQLANSMGKRPWEANQFSASQEIPSVLQNPKVHYRIRNSQPPVPILSHSNLVHVPHPTS